MYSLLSNTRASLPTPLFIRAPVRSVLAHFSYSSCLCKKVNDLFEPILFHSSFINAVFSTQTTKNSSSNAITATMSPEPPQPGDWHTASQLARQQKLVKMPLVKMIPKRLPTEFNTNLPLEYGLFNNYQRDHIIDILTMHTTQMCDRIGMLLHIPPALEVGNGEHESFMAALTIRLNNNGQRSVQTAPYYMTSIPIPAFYTDSDSEDELDNNAYHFITSTKRESYVFVGFFHGGTCGLLGRR